MHILIIVESPHKARAVAQYARGVFPGETRVISCLGHLRDLPPGDLGIDIKHGFRPLYEIPQRRRKTVSHLRSLVRQADRVILATDPDREGEAVAWHVVKVFEVELQGKPVARAAFNAVTREAVQAALKNLRPLNPRQVKAAIARRVMDRLIGYQISPRLWAAVEGKGHSAGRVQSVALRLLIEQVDKDAAAGDTWMVEVEL